MKQLVLLFCAYALFSLAAQTQSIGFYAGTNISTFETPVYTHPYSWHANNEEIEPRTGYQIGTVVNVEVNKFLDISSGAKYVQRGGIFKSSFELEFTHEQVGHYTYNTHSETKITANWLEVPVALRFVYRREKMTYYASAGANISIGLHAKETTTSGFSETYDGMTRSNWEANSKSLTFGEKKQDDLEKVSLGFAPAIGMQWRKVFMDISYHHGLEDISGMSNLDLTQHSLALSIGMMIDKQTG